MTLAKRDSWFVNYDTTRDLAARTRHFVAADFRSATVLDVGCNVGQMSRWAMEQGARHVLGIDYDRDAIAKARQMTANQNITYSVEDADLPGCWRGMPRVDVVLFLAVYLTQELNCKEAILANVAAKALKVMYFEGHANQTQGYTVERYVADLVKWTDFDNIEYLGDTDAPGCRPLFRCWRGALGAVETVERIHALTKTHRRIVVVGKSAAGKSLLFKLVTDGLAEHSHTFYDDVKPPYGAEKFVLFDWRGLEYVPDADAVVFVRCDEDERQRRIDAVPVKDRLLRTSPGVVTNARTVLTCEVR